MQKKIKRMNKGVFLGAFLLIPFLPLLQPIVVTCIYSITSNGKLMLVFAWAYFVFMLGVWLLVIILFHYRMWFAVHGEYVNTSPVMAVVLLFVPIYNIYWMFKLYPNFVGYYEMYVNLNDLEVPPFETRAHRAFPRFFLTSIIFGVLSIIISFLSVLEALFTLAAYVAFLIIVYQTCTAVSNLADAVEGKTSNSGNMERPADALWGRGDSNMGTNKLVDEVRGEVDGTVSIDQPIDSVKGNMPGDGGIGRIVETPKGAKIWILPRIDKKR